MERHTRTHAGCFSSQKEERYDSARIMKRLLHLKLRRIFNSVEAYSEIKDKNSRTKIQKTGSNMEIISSCMVTQINQIYFQTRTKNNSRL